MYHTNMIWWKHTTSIALIHWLSNDKHTCMSISTFEQDAFGNIHSIWTVQSASITMANKHNEFAALNKIHVNMYYIWTVHSTNNTLYNKHMYLPARMCTWEACKSERVSNWIVKRPHFFVFGLPELDSEVASLLRVGPEGWLQYQG